MEFSINKPSKHSVRSNPYSSGGKSHFRSIKKSIPKRMITHSTPPRKYNHINHQTYSHRSSSFKPRSLSRASHILQNSQASNNLKESSKQSKWISKIDTSSSPSRPIKRPFKSLELSLDTSSDPYNIFSDEDDDDIFLSAKHDKLRANATNKENKLQFSVSKNTPKVYTNNVNKKIKTVDILSSNILHDISPEKVNISLESEKKYVKVEPKNGYRFKRLIGKENSHESSQEEEENLVPNVIEHSHMIGFPNFGNTCYLNAVLQTLVSLQPFIGDLNSAMEVLSVPSTSVVHSLWNIIIARYKLDFSLIRNSLRAMKENIEKVDGSFSGFKMQDANFLSGD